MKIKNPEKRLTQFWGKVDQKHIHSFEPFITGNRILDMGCGYGTTSFTLTQSGLTCIGIDNDQTAIDYCKLNYPQVNFQFATAEQLPFEDDYFDCIVLRDALHHFYREADFEKVKSEILRVSNSNALIIFFDPNVNFLLKILRRLSFHNDAECTYKDALQITRDLNLTVIHTSFNTVFSLPLSGGYVGINFTPNIQWVQHALLKIERSLEYLLNKSKLDRYVCWRYLIVGWKK